MPTFGLASPGGSEWTGTGNILAGYRTTPVTPFYASAMYVYGWDVTGTSEVRLGLYADNAGSPGSLLAQTANFNISGSAWSGASLNTTVLVQAGTYYWLAWHSPNTLLLSGSETAVSGHIGTAASTYTSGIMPPYWGGNPIASIWQFPIYATDGIVTQQYRINGAGASLPAAQQRWRPVQTGRYNHKRLLQTDWEIELMFPACSITHMRQWCEPASAASANVTVLNKYKTAYTDLSGVHLTIGDPPAIEAGLSGPFTLIIQGVTG